MTDTTLDLIRDIVGDVFNGFIFTTAMLSRDAETTVSPAAESWEVGAVETTFYPCKALVDEWNATYIARGLVNAGERKILILGSSINTTPAPGDRILVEGETFTIVPAGSGQPAVSRDPARAIWTVRAVA